MTPARERELLDIKGRLFAALRSGALGSDNLNFLKGFGQAMNSPDHRRPSPKQIRIAEQLDRETRHADDDEPLMLIDREDMG